MPTVPEIITANIIEQLEKGVAPWRKPWSTSIPRNLISKKPYRGLNVFLVATQGYGSPYWLTFNQAKQLGAHVRKGEKSTLVSFWKFSELSKENRETGELETKNSVLLRYYRVFNVEQCEGLRALHGDEHKPVNPLVECESIANQMPNPLRFEQHSQAFYQPSADVVGMPSRTCFESLETYYSTLFHELTHSTGHKSRLNRFEEHTTDHQFGSESYSKEELVAEIGAAMLAGMAGISHATLNNSAAYLQTWIRKLKSDSRLIISAASHGRRLLITSSARLNAKGASNERHICFSHATRGEISSAHDCRFRRVGQTEADSQQIRRESLSVRLAVRRTSGNRQNFNGSGLGRDAPERGPSHSKAVMQRGER